MTQLLPILDTVINLMKSSNTDDTYKIISAWNEQNADIGESHVYDLNANTINQLYATPFDLLQACDNAKIDTSDSYFWVNDNNIITFTHLDSHLSPISAISLSEWIMEYPDNEYASDILDCVA